MTTTVTITGTGTPLATHDRAGAGVLVRHDDTHLQFDAGRATVPRMLSAGSSPAELAALFLTHYHSDHLVGLQDLVLTHWTMDVYDKAGRLPIFAPNGPTIDFCEHMLDIWDDDLEVRALHNKRDPHPKIDIIGFETPEEPTEVWSGGDVRVIAGPVRHEPIIGAVGYRIETPDGVVAISGDTLVCDEVADLCRGADVVVYEALRMDVIATRPPDKQYIMHYHADTRLIGEQMAELGVPTLLLTHLIPAPSTPAEKQAFADEVREGGYEGEIMVCDDLDSVTLREGSIT
ncbi:MAG: MBL fold metallo-hydrolase [Acidimicrobiales bacterium]|nr:MBL fold metallo-hydrolase [Acidimicrobiales bacterium]RZV47001.1 MAG: MBL fold metallo-hydrolase [Acidimicrobiales bacterium]